MTHSPTRELVDPRNKYARPPFTKQTQQPPGSVSKMNPVPDHGEESYKGTGKLTGLVAIITGADSGIGRAVALAYAREGADVVFTYLKEEQDAQVTEQLIREAGVRSLKIMMDQTDRKACDEVVDKCLKQFGRLDILVNNAAFQATYENFDDIPDDEIAKAFNTNVLPCFYFSRKALKHISPGGSIINTASIQSFSPSVYLAPYAATKGAIANFTLSLAEAAMQRGVRVNGVAPGPVWTPLIPSTMPEDKTQHFGENTLFKRPAQPAELAPIYVFLASQDASYITGEIYGVTGGRMQM